MKRKPGDIPCVRRMDVHCNQLYKQEKLWYTLFVENTKVLMLREGSY